MGIVAWVVVGALVGMLISLLGGRPIAWMANVIFAIISALLGGAVYSFFAGYSVLEFSMTSLAAAMVGAAVVLVNVRLIRRRRRAGR